MRAGGVRAASVLGSIALAWAPGLAQEYRWSDRIGEVPPPFDALTRRPFPASPLGDDPPGGTHEEIRDLVVGPDGDFYVVGTFGGKTDFDFGPGHFYMTPVGLDDVFIVRLGPDGTFRWARQIGANSSGVAWGVSLDGTGHLYIAGTFQGTIDFDPGPGKQEKTSADYSGYILRLDLQGVFSWVRVFDFSWPPADLVSDTAGNVYACGSFGGTVDFDPGAGMVQRTSFGANDGFVVKLSSAGNFAWVAQQGGTLDDATSRVGVDAVGGVYSAGFFNGTADFDPGPGTFWLTAVGPGQEMSVSRLSTTGALVWAERIGGPGSEKVQGLVLDASGRIHISGTFGGTVDFDPGPEDYPLSAFAGVDPFVLRLDADGALEWAASLGDPGSAVTTSAEGLAVDGAGNVYVSGWFNTPADFDPGPGQFILDDPGGSILTRIYVWKLDAAGELAWAGMLKGSTWVDPVAVGVDDAERIVVAGTFNGWVDLDPGLPTADTNSLFLDGFLLSLGPFSEIPGAVPGGDGSPGMPLTLSRVGSLVLLDWDPACNATDYAVMVGKLLELSDGYSHQPTMCSTNGETLALLNQPGDVYFLIVPHNGVLEGSYGRDSSGAERPGAPIACLPQLVGECP